MDDTGGCPDGGDCIVIPDEADKLPVVDASCSFIVENERLLHKFGFRLAQLVAPGAQKNVVQGAIAQAVEELRDAAVAGGNPFGGFPRARDAGLAAGKNLELVFVHDCRNYGCNSVQCILCKHNPNKRCLGNFAHKYWVGDRLLGKCDGDIQVELIDENQQRFTGDLTNIRLEVSILDGNKYASRCRELGEQKAEILDECEVLKNQKGEALLVAGSSANDSGSLRVVLKFPSNGHAVTLRELKVTESSESVLAGTKRPPFRLVVHAVTASGERMPEIRPAVSEQFVVVTKRTKNLKKQEIPSLDDPISKLNHIGKETVKKLNELKTSADEAALPLKIPRDLFKVMKVRDFQRLAELSEADGHLQQKLKQLLKLSKEKWDSACDHAKTAVQVDNRMRAWYTKDMSCGLLYSCVLGNVRPDCPVALINNRLQDGSEIMEVIPMEHQLPAQRQQVQSTCEQAVQSWWDDNHPGWMIFTLGNKHFETLDQIIAYSQGDGQNLGEANDDWGNQRTSDEEGGKGGTVAVIEIKNGGRDNSVDSVSSGPSGQSPGEADTRFMHDRQMPPPSQSFMAQNGPAEAGAGPMSRVHNAEGMGPSTGGARALGTPDIQPGFAGAPNAMNLTPGMLESLGPLVSQLMSVGGLSSFASLQSLMEMQRFQSQHHQQQGGNSHQTPSPSAAQPSDQGSHMQSHYETLGRGPSGSIPLANPGPPPVAAPVVSKSNYNPFESMQRVPFPGALGGSQGQPTPADSGVQGDGLHGQQPVMQNPSLPWGPNEAAAAATFSGLLPTWGPSGNFLNMPNLSAMDPQVAQQVLSVMGSVSNLNSFSSNGFKGLASFPNIPGLTGPLSQDFHPDLALGAHMHSQNQLSGPPPTRNVLMPGAGDDRHESTGGKRPRIV